MYDPSNFVVLLKSNQLTNLTTGSASTITFSIENNDDTQMLYNISLELSLGDGLELVDSSVPFTSANNNVYIFTNIKDLSPNESYNDFTIKVKLNTKFTNGSDIPFGTLILCTMNASADTMPRGSYDSFNEIIEAITSFSFKASKYTIIKNNPTKMILGSGYYSSIIITTAENSNVTFESIEDFLGNGITYEGSLTISGYISTPLSNVKVSVPNAKRDEFKLSWSSVYIPAGKTVEIKYKVRINERYYSNGFSTGEYITQGSSIKNTLIWSVDKKSFSYEYKFIAYELLLSLSLSRYMVDIRTALTYFIQVQCNSYHRMLGVTVGMTTSDGQLLSDTSSPLYSNKTMSPSGVTQVIWDIGNIESASTVSISIDGSIVESYLSSESPILSGDSFTVSSSCIAISETTNKNVVDEAKDSMQIGIPDIQKEITGYYYRDMSSKDLKISAPGDFIRYKIIYNSLNIQAPSKFVKIFDFFPYMTKDIESIKYIYSSQDYPGAEPYTISPNGKFWYIADIPGSQSFDIEYTTELDANNVRLDFPYNLAKLQVENSKGIRFSTRDQVGFTLGIPNLVLKKSVSGNNKNKIKIGDIYSINSVLKNNDISKTATDAFNVVFSEQIPDNITLIKDSVTASINDVSVPYTIDGKTINLTIDKLAPDSEFVLSYQISVDDTLGPNTKFNFTSTVQPPYTQSYDEDLDNVQYDINPLVKSASIKSEDISTNLDIIEPEKLVGETVFYAFNVLIPQGIKLSSISAAILIPPLQDYLDEATLNGEPVDAVFSPTQSAVIFPSIDDIDTTSGAISYRYLIKCIISDSIVSPSNNLVTAEGIYGYLTYVDLFKEEFNIGSNAFLNVNHPYLSLDIGSSLYQDGFAPLITANTKKDIYTKVTIDNISKVVAKNSLWEVFIPSYLSFDKVVSHSNGVSYVYNEVENKLSISSNTITPDESVYIIFKSMIKPGKVSESNIVISADISQYQNTISDSKIYLSDFIRNSTIYINSMFSFMPLSKYKLLGSTAAINLSGPGVPTQISYSITNLGQGMDSFMIQATPIKYSYDVYINDVFIENIPPEKSAFITDELINNLENGDSAIIDFRYTIPKSAERPFYDTMLVSVKSLNNPNSLKIVPTTLQDP